MRVMSTVAALVGAWVLGTAVPVQSGEDRKVDLVKQNANPRPADRVILEGVPRIGYGIHLCPFPGSLSACLEYLGDPCDYDFLMGVSGAAFRRLWERDDGGNVDLMYLAPEPHRRVFEALGYRWRTVPREKGQMVAAIRDSLARGRPVIAFGIIGPPEAGIVAGYERGGEVLHGWSYFQDGAKQGYYRLDGWLEKMSEGPPFGLIVMGGKRESRPSRREVLASSLEWAVDLARRSNRPGLPNHVCGLAAYDAWADALEVDADYPADDLKALQTRAMVHCDQVVMLHERGSAAAFLRQLADVAPEATERLSAAAALYDEVAAAGSKVWRWKHWMQPEAHKAMAHAATRREFAKQIRAAAAKESQAVEHLEAALAALRDGKEAGAAVSHLELQGSKLINYPPEFRTQIECMPVPGVLRALMEFMGEDFGYTTNKGGNVTWRTNEAFPLFMGVWGDSFEFIWLRKDGAQAGDDAPPDTGDMAQRFAATLEAAGFECEVALKPGPAGNRVGNLPFEQDLLRRRIVESIADWGWPAIALELPKRGHASIITGYDRAGEVLIGWGVEGGDDRGIQFEHEKQLAIGDWFAKAQGVVLLAGKHPRPPEPQVYRRALEQGLRFLRMREAGQFHAGPATFDAWAKSLEDETLSTDDAATAKRRRRILDPMIWDLATRRHYGALFLRRAAELFPQAAADLVAAQECFRAEHDLMWEINRLGGAKWPGQELPQLIDPAVREMIAALILRARDKDIEAAAHIEAALAR